MSDTFSETTSRSWLGRIKDALVGLVFGGALFAGSFPLLYWNESRAVTTAQSMKEGAKSVVAASPDRVDPAQEGALVHVSGPATTSETLADPAFGVSLVAVKLRRKVELRQWDEDSKSETRTKLGGGEETVRTYSYKQIWSEEPIDSSEFKDPAGHENPRDWPYQGQAWQAGDVRLGAFSLSSSLVGRMGPARPLAAAEAGLPPETAGRLRASDGSLFSGDPAAPKVGDVRISFEAVEPMTVSVVARQVGGGFEPYPTRAGRSLELLEPGTRSAESMFQEALSRNATLTWLLRAGGWLLMSLGLFLILRPLSVLADVVPFMGRLLGAGLGLAAALVSLALSMATIAVAWVAVRPLIGVPLLVGAVLVLTGALRRGSRQAVPAAQPG